MTAPRDGDWSVVFKMMLVV